MNNQEDDRKILMMAVPLKHVRLIQAELADVMMMNRPTLARFYDDITDLLKDSDEETDFTA